jgi:hypothetical protein
MLSVQDTSGPVGAFMMMPARRDPGLGAVRAGIGWAQGLSFNTLSISFHRRLPDT